MRKNVLSMVVLVCVVCLISTITFAAPFEPLFKVKTITGKCQICLPDATEFLAVEEGKAYPYGSKITTGRKSSLVIEFSESNECRVLANAVLTVTEDIKDTKLKIIKLDEGKVEVALEETFNKNNGLNVETATAICGAIGCKFGVNAQRERDLTVAAIICEEGKINASGPGFNIPLMKGGDGVSVSCSLDKIFTRVKTIKGEVTVTIKDAEGKPKDVVMAVGAIAKIWQKVSDTGDALVVTILIVAPDGKLLESITYTKELTEELKQKLEKEKADKEEKEKEDKEKWEKVTTTTTTTVTMTTTTTVPSPTPVGKR